MTTPTPDLEPPIQVRLPLASLSKDKPTFFPFHRARQDRQGFVLWVAESWKVYVNICPHAPLPLDFGDGQVLEGQELVCSNHGARFSPADGRCLSGPPRGKSLEAPVFYIEGDEFVIEIAAKAPGKVFPKLPEEPLDFGW